MSPISARRRVEKAAYDRRRPVYLREHPFCQWWLAENGFTEAQAFDSGGYLWITFDSANVAAASRTGVPRSTQVHHKNKRRGKMLLEESFWMAVSDEGHEAIERDKKKARAKGYLLNF